MSATTEHHNQPHTTAGERARPVLRWGGAAFWLSGLLVVTAAANGLLTFLVPGVLHGTAVMNGSARGTALAVLLLGVPVLAVSMALARAGSARAVLCWLGAAGFVLYNSRWTSGLGMRPTRPRRWLPRPSRRPSVCWR